MGAGWREMMQGKKDWKEDEGERGSKGYGDARQWQPAQPPAAHQKTAATFTRATVHEHTGSHAETRANIQGFPQTDCGKKKKKKALAFFCPWPVSDDWSGTYLRLSFIRLCTHKYQGLSKDFTSTHYIKDQHMKDNWFSFSGAYPGYIITKKRKKNIQKRDSVG